MSRLLTTDQHELLFAVHPRFHNAPTISHHPRGLVFATWSWTITVLVTGSIRFGMIPGKDRGATFEALVGHPLRSHRAFAEEAAANG
jgi:hypothetical protein